MVSRPMLDSHPAAPQIDREMLAHTLETLGTCALTCMACADACIAEPTASDLARCIRTDLDCADICTVTATILVRQTEPHWGLVRAQLQACITACQACAEECERHASHHEHCRICAEHCRTCTDACNQMLDALPA